MEKIKKYIKPIIYYYTLLFLYLVIITVFNYFDILSYKAISIISFITIILLFMMTGFMSALKTYKKGYIIGLIIGGFNVLIFLLLIFILGEQFKLNILIYFSILLLSSTVGGMFGINYKNKIWIIFHHQKF